MNKQNKIKETKQMKGEYITYTMKYKNTMKKDNTNIMECKNVLNDKNTRIMRQYK